MEIDETLTSEVLNWFQALDNGAGANVREGDLKHFVLSLQLARAAPHISESKVGKDDFSQMRAALETILEIAPTWIENGRRAAADAEGTAPDDILRSYHDANADLWAVVESTRNLLLKGRLRYRPTRKPHMDGFWHRDAEWFGHLAVSVLDSRRNRRAGLNAPTAPAIRIVQNSLYYLYRQTFSEVAIIKAIKDKRKKDKKQAEIVRSRAAHLRSIVLPDAEGYPGTRGPDDVADD